MDYFALILPLLLILGLFVGLVALKRRMFGDDSSQAPIPIPDVEELKARPRNEKAPNVKGSRGGKSNTATAARSVDEKPAGRADAPAPPAAPAAVSKPQPGADAPSLSPARLYPTPVLSSTHKRVFSRLLQALPGYAVLPLITYDRFLEAHDGTPSENTSLHNRAGQQLADFVICDRKLNVLLVCQVEDGTHLPARTQEREKMLQKAGLRLLRWNVDQPPDAAKLLNTVQTLERLNTNDARASG